MNPAPGPVLVMGAGSIGCYVGGCLQASGGGGGGGGGGERKNEGEGVVGLLVGGQLLGRDFRWPGRCSGRHWPC